ncbi:hypothetical protein GCM10008931_44300 [Oceanobacillus oncorhynchi subsp. oncorhynchi]|uniref:DUF1653 domain-containing protein n=1 Tax=Oceanobacillus oncorhynchi TaxID=545501 RepID=UPI0031CFB1A8
MANVYKHYKGGIYNVIGTGIHTETEEKLVFYEGADGRLWARPFEMFIELIEVDGKTVPRFEPLGSFFRN